MARLLRAFALSAALLAPTGVALADEAAAIDPAAVAPGTADADIQGAVGVCVRWGADPSKLAEVVVVKPSGDVRVDALAVSTLQEMPFSRPDGDNGAWRAMNLGIGGAEPSDVAPDCAGLAAVSDDGPVVSPPLPKQIAA